MMRILLIIVVTLVVIGCATPLFPEKTQRESDVEQCTYGTVVPHNIDQRHRAAYISESVAGCMKAKGYSEAEATP